MKVVQIPLFGLELKWNPIAFTIGNVPVYWYAILIVASLVLALFRCKKKDGTYGIHYEDILDLSIILIPISFICARLYYILFNLDFYTSMDRILNIKDGGLAIYGGIIGGVITAYIFCKKRNINIWNLLDYVVPYLALGQAIGRWGNFINVEAYGEVTNLPWKMGIEVNGQFSYVHPTFFYESIGNFILFIILVVLSKKRKYEGQITKVYLLGYSFLRFWIEGIRTDSLMLGGFRISQVLSFILFFIMIGVLLLDLKKR